MYRAPERGMSTYPPPPPTPKGLANGSHPSSEEREELPRSVLHQHRSDCVETPKERGHRPV